MNSRLLIVGGSSDIARCFAARWLREDLTRTALLHVATSEHVMSALLNEFGDRIQMIDRDLSTKGGVDQFMALLQDQVPSVDRALFCAALPFRLERASKFDWEFFERDSNIQFRTVVEFCRLVLLEKHRSSRVRIALTLSAVVVGAPPGYTSMYTALKYALLGYMKAVAAEASNRIQINALAPGMVETRFIEVLPESVKKAAAEGMHSNRLLTPDEIADGIQFLLEGAPPQVNGSVLPIGCIA